MTNEKHENNMVANQDVHAKMCVQISILVQLVLIQALCYLIVFYVCIQWLERAGFYYIVQELKQNTQNACDGIILWSLLGIVWVF